MPYGVRDARAVVGGVLAVLVVGILATRSTDVDPLLTRVLPTLPAEVVAVILETDRASVLRPVLQQLLRLPHPTLPLTPSPIATLLLDTEHGVVPLALFDRGKAQHAGLQGSVYGGFVAIGDNSLVARLRSESPQSTSRLPVEAVQFLTRASPASLRVLVRLPFLAEQFPLLGIPSAPEAVLAVAAEAQHGRLALSGVIAGPRNLHRTPASLIAVPVPGSLLVIDGVPASELLPPELPPVLAALAQEAGITTELADIARILNDRPVTLVLQGRAGSVPDIVVAIRRTKTGDAELAGALRALLFRRGALATFRTEALRINGRSIRHQRPGLDPAGAVRETVDGPWRMLEAPRAAGTKDLVRAERDDLFVVGTSKAAVLAVGDAIPPAGQGLRGRAIIHLAADGTLLRREPLVSHVLQNVPPAFRTWAETLRTLRLDVFDSRRSLRFFLTSEFESGALPRAF